MSSHNPFWVTAKASPQPSLVGPTVLSQCIQKRHESAPPSFRATQSRINRMFSTISEAWQPIAKRGASATKGSQVRSIPSVSHPSRYCRYRRSLLSLILSGSLPVAEQTFNLSQGPAETTRSIAECADSSAADTPYLQRRISEDNPSVVRSPLRKVTSGALSPPSDGPSQRLSITLSISIALSISFALSISIPQLTTEQL